MPLDNGMKSNFETYLCRDSLEQDEVDKILSYTNIYISYDMSMSSPFVTLLWCFQYLLFTENVLKPSAIEGPLSEGLLPVVNLDRVTL